MQRLMIQDNSIYIYIYVPSINTTNHIRTKTTTCFGLITGSSSGCTGLVRRLYNRIEVNTVHTFD